MKSAMPSTALNTCDTPQAAGRARRRGSLPRLPMLRGRKCADGRKAYPEDLSHG